VLQAAAPYLVQLITIIGKRAISHACLRNGWRIASA
jgi:hypothetical protein